MEIKYVKGNPYFCDVDKPIKQRPYLDEDIECDILIIGGGINGAICHYYLSKAGIKTILIEKNRLGQLSTSCATALLEYQLDEHSKDLQAYLSDNEIKKSYEIGLQSLSDLDEYFKKNKNECFFSLRPSLLYTQNKNEIKSLTEEYNFRISNGFDCKLLDNSDKLFNFDFEAGLFCENGGAEFNPYLFTKQMINHAEKLGSKTYENTEAIEIDYGIENCKVNTRYGNTITCKKVICATGYNSSLFTDRQLCQKFISYTIVTKPMPNFEWYERTLLQDNGDPYHYIRLSEDNRLIIGGEDIDFKNDIIKEKDALKKYELLENYLYELFPSLKGIVEIEYKFCGTFATSLDNLAIYGPSKEQPNLWYAYGYGANGIIDTVAASQMMANLFFGKMDDNLKLFSPDRKLV